MTSPTRGRQKKKRSSLKKGNNGKPPSSSPTRQSRPVRRSQSLQRVTFSLSPKRGPSPSTRRRSSTPSRKLNTTLGGTMTYQGTSTSTMMTSTMRAGNHGDVSTAFCRKVKHAFRDKPRTYRKFVKIMSEIKDDDSDKLDIIKRVILLFDGYPHLVREFNMFLPIDYRIEIQGDAVLVKVFDGTDEDAVGLVETGTLGMLTTSDTMTYGPGYSTMSTLGGRLTTQKSFDGTSTLNNTDALGETQFGTDTLGPNKDATLEYIKKVKTAFSSKPRIYRRFMEALRAYHKDETDVLDTIKKIIGLFQNHTDLVLAFNEFLPKSHRIRMVDRSGYIVQHPSSTEEDTLESFQIMLDQRFL